MTENEVEKIRNLVIRGAKVMIGSEPSGRRRIKVKHGPFQLLVSRFTCEPEQFDHVMSVIKRQNNLIPLNSQYSTSMRQTPRLPA